MILFKSRNSSGVSFIEVTVVLLIVGIMLTSLFNLQSSSFFSFMNYVRRAQRMLLLTNEWVEQKKSIIFKMDTLEKEKAQKEQTIKIDDPPTKIIFKRSSLSEKSALKDICSLYIERTEGSWDSIFGTQTETLITFAYIPEPEQKEGKT